jgi:hypothetical protein
MIPGIIDENESVKAGRCKYRIFWLQTLGNVPKSRSNGRTEAKQSSEQEDRNIRKYAQWIIWISGDSPPGGGDIRIYSGTQKILLGPASRAIALNFRRADIRDERSLARSYYLKWGILVRGIGLSW